jgi:Rrf2 family nitric oxide-sensitive transcriptional repressor
MQLTLYTDYSLRVLLYLGVHSDELVTIGEIADAYKISRNHLVKVVHHLASMGFVHTTRGKGGGVRLMRPPEEIRLGEVIRSTEGGFELVECMNSATNTCPIDQLCALKGVVREALSAFTSVWDRYTLADVLRNRGQLAEVLVPLPRRPSAS